MITSNVYLTGFMGTGKSTVASCLGRRLEVDVIEMDAVIVETEKQSIADIFGQKGEAFFRELETSLLRELCEKSSKIVSCGGGVVLREENVELMKKSGKIVLLTASPEEIGRRLNNDDSRPLLREKKSPEAIKTVLDVRKEKYEKAADITISTDGKSVEEISEELIEKLKRVKERE